MTDKEVMQMALDVLANNRYAPSIKETTEALRAALAQPEPKNDEYCPACDGDYCIAKAGCVALIKPPQPEPEPVAWTVSGLITDFSRDFSAYKTKTYTRPLYTAPTQREWVGLTDDERDEIYNNNQAWVHAVEAKLKERNNG